MAVDQKPVNTYRISVFTSLTGFLWWALLDSNQRPSDYEMTADVPAAPGLSWFIPFSTVSDFESSRFGSVRSGWFHLVPAGIAVR